MITACVFCILLLVISCHIDMLFNVLLAGLDSTSAAQVVDILASLAHRGVNVMLSIHQPRPDILRLMDSLLVLSPSGRLVYSGPTDSLDSHLAVLNILPPPGTLNVADYLLDYVISSSPQQLKDMVTIYQQSDVRNKLRQQISAMVSHTESQPIEQLMAQLPPGATRRPFGLQLWMLSAVLFRRMYRHPFLVSTGFVATLVAAVSLAVAFWNTGYDTQVHFHTEEALHDSSALRVL
jgi:ATP-binding cassette, subfamily G (WHITE), member 2